MAAIQSLVNQRVGSTLRAIPIPPTTPLPEPNIGASGNAPVQFERSATLPSRHGFTCIFYDVTQGDIDVNCTPLTGTLHNCNRPTATGAGVLSTGAITTLSLTAAGAGYTSVPACTIAAPNNSTTAYNGGTAATQATCTATINGATHVVNSVTLNNAGNGYATNSICTLSGGGGAGAEVRRIRRGQRDIPGRISSHVRLGLCHGHRHGKRLQPGLRFELVRRSQ